MDLLAKKLLLNSPKFTNLIKSFLISGSFFNMSIPQKSISNLKKTIEFNIPIINAIKKDNFATLYNVILKSHEKIFYSLPFYFYD